MKVEVDVLGSPSLKVLMVSVDVKQHSKTLFYKDCSLGLVTNLTTSPC